MATVTPEGREITDASMCDFKNGRCNQLKTDDINFTVPSGCSYHGILNGGDPCEGCCMLKDYDAEENWNVAKFKQGLASGEIRFT